MWDVEGKEIDTYVVKKLLSLLPGVLPRARDRRGRAASRCACRTPRSRRPRPRSCSRRSRASRAPTTPRASSTARRAADLRGHPADDHLGARVDRVYHYYADFIVGGSTRVSADDITIAEWIGEFRPSAIEVIPLFEDVSEHARAADIVEEYLADKDVSDQRVFLARSDTAMNYGLVSAALSNKIALARLDELASAPACGSIPILGMGSAPFRGGCRRAPPSASGASTRAWSRSASSRRSSSTTRSTRSAPRASTSRRARSDSCAPSTSSARSRSSSATAGVPRRIVELAPQINRMAKYVPAPCPQAARRPVRLRARARWGHAAARDLLHVLALLARAAA
jgi:phosphoenolpyruvate carboxylase